MHCGIMRNQMFTISVWLGFQILKIGRQCLSAILVVLKQVNFLAALLEEPILLTENTLPSQIP